jgi:hypothetical protein
MAGRSEAVRLALQLLVEQQRRRRIGASIVEGYLRHPQTASEVGWTDGATTEMIAEELW